MKKLTALILFFSLIFIASKPVLAQIASTTVIPPRLEITANPGQTLTQELKVRNETDSTQYYAVDVTNFIVSDNFGTPIPISDTVNTRWGMKSWIKAPSVIPVDPKQTAVVKITINVPQNALPGGHYALITYQPNPDFKAAQLRNTGSIIGQRTGTILYLTVSGPITQNATATQFTAPLFNEFGPVPFNGVVSNSSDIHVNAKGNIFISNLFGQQIAQLPVETGNVFPGATRAFKTDWNQKWGYGRYTATLDLAYGTAGGVITSTIFFWLFPIRLVIYTLIVIISILFIIIILNQKNKKHQKELEKEVLELKKEVEAKERKR